MPDFNAYQHSYSRYRLDRTDEGVLTVQFNSDGGPLVWGFEALEQLANLWSDIAQDAGNKLVIVSGAGDGFIPSMEISGRSRMTAETWQGVASNVRRLIRGHLGIPVPMIAAVNGPARFHSEQALLCDIVIASEAASFQDGPHFIAGLVPGDGAQIIYTHLLGANRARYFLLTGQELDASKALDYGLVSEVVPAEDLMKRVNVLAQKLMAQPEIVRRNSRQVLIEPVRRLYSDLLDHGLCLQGLGACGSWPFER